MATSDLPDIGSLQPPPDLPDVGSLTAPEQTDMPRMQAGMPIRGGGGQVMFSPGVVSRFRDSDAISRTIAAAAKGLGEGYGDSVPGADAHDVLVKAGVFPSREDIDHPSAAGTLRFFNQSLLQPAISLGDAFLRLWPAAVEATHQGVTQAATEAGAEQPEAVGREAGGALEIAGTDAGIQTMLLSRAQYAEATRIARNPAGGVYDQRIGPVPDHAEATVQAAQVAEHYGIPDAAPAISAAYEKGVLPAEIFHDAKVDPTILPHLAEGKVPEAYPVSDWMGAEAAPEAAGKPAGAAAPEAAPARPVVPTRLRPIEGTGEQTPMQLSQSVEEQVGKVFDSVPASRVAENAVQEAAARKFVDLDPERADQVAMNGATPPKNLLGQMVFNEVLRRADAAGDMDKVRMLATQGAQSGMLRRFGQEVQAASRLGPEGEIAERIQQLQEKRTADLKAQGIDVPQEQAKGQAEFTPIREATKNLRGAGAWEKFMQSIQCPE